MDGRTFDDLVRSFATRSNRRRFLQRGAVAAAAGALLSAAPASAARRGKPPAVSICKPDGAGGYTRASVSPSLLLMHLAAGAVRDSGCCAHSECGAEDDCSSGVCDPVSGACGAVWVADGTECTPDGQINLCRVPYTCQAGVCSEGDGGICAEVAGGCTRLIGCNPSTGLCDYGPAPDGTSCNRESGCVPGSCSAGVCLDPPVKTCPGDACRPCGYDACQDACTCVSIGCGSPEPQCLRAHCDPEIGCVNTPINEGQPCGTGEGTICYQGVCTAVVQDE